jgi:hypothetical protein
MERAAIIRIGLAMLIAAARVVFRHSKFGCSYNLFLKRNAVFADIKQERRPPQDPLGRMLAFR